MSLGAYPPDTITALADLINAEEDSDSEDDMPSNYYAKLTPANIGNTKSQPKAELPSKKLAKREKDEKSIWDTEEIQEGAQYDDVYDTRIPPDYDIIYKQSVGTEEVFLGMGSKTPATASCEDMVIKIKLPDTQFKDVSVDLTDKFLSVRSPKYKLGLHLPHPCESKDGKAQWISDKYLLQITVRMKREYDFMNF